MPSSILVGCVSRKTDYPAPARDLYASDLYRKRRAYAEASGRPWFILSAKYGLVQPDTLLNPYDETLDHKSRSALLQWGEKAISKLEQIVGPLKGHMLEIHAGKRYVAGVEAPLLSRGAEIVVPLRGLAIGKQLHWYKSVLPKKAD